MDNTKRALEQMATTVKMMIDVSLRHAEFDRSCIGLVIDGGPYSNHKEQYGGNYVYKVKAFGTEYEIESSNIFRIQDRVAVVAPQGNFSQLYMVKI